MFSVISTVTTECVHGTVQDLHFERWYQIEVGRARSTKEQLVKIDYGGGFFLGSCQPGFQAIKVHDWK